MKNSVKLIKKSALIFLLVIFTCLFSVVAPSCGDKTDKSATTAAETTVAETTAATTPEPTTPTPTTTAAPEVLQEVLKWTFSDTDNPFKASAQISNFRVENGILKFTSTGGDPNITTVSNTLGINAADVNYIKFKIKNYAPGFANQLFFITDEDTKWDEAKSFKNEYWNSDGEDWEELTFDTSECDLWTGTIKQIRFDPLNEAGDIEIEYVSFDKIVG